MLMDPSQASFIAGLVGNNITSKATSLSCDTCNEPVL